jgi:hypothetical protein
MSAQYLRLVQNQEAPQPVHNAFWHLVPNPLSVPLLPNSSHTSRLGPRDSALARLEIRVAFITIGLGNVRAFHGGWVSSMPGTRNSVSRGLLYGC